MIIGEIITFGKHKWRILNVNNEKILIISENVIENLYISEKKALFEKVDINWYKSKNIINNIEIINNFTDEEKSKIFDTTFCLSRLEAEKYFNNDSDRIAYSKNGKPLTWLLRSIGGRSDFDNDNIHIEYNDYVKSNGVIDVAGDGFKTIENDNIRIAFWLKI